ncbi:MAG: propanediol utilization protein, partial [Arenicella sp.]
SNELGALVSFTRKVYKLVEMSALAAVGVSNRLCYLSKNSLTKPFTLGYKFNAEAD